jgi:hypothetical protein
MFAHAAIINKSDIAPCNSNGVVFPPLVNVATYTHYDRNSAAIINKSDIAPCNSNGDVFPPLASDATYTHYDRNSAAIIYINVSGVNALALGSKLEAARAFKHWVTSDVLPAIGGRCWTDKRIATNDTFGVVRVCVCVCLSDYNHLTRPPAD